MGMKENNKKIKYILIVVFCIMLAMTFHVIGTKYSTTPPKADWSFLVRSFGLIPTIFAWYFIAFGCTAYIFYRYEDKLEGSCITKGLSYGIGIGILWLWAMPEGVSLYGNPFINELVTGGCDAVPIIVMGLLLGIFTGRNNNHKDRKKPVSLSNILIPCSVFSSIFTAGRYFFYCTGIMRSGYHTHPGFTFVWTLLMGTCIGITYILLGKAAQSSTKLLSAIKFGNLIFGANWLVFMVFMPCIINGLLTDLIIRAVIDITLVILSYYVSESLIKRNESFHFQNV